MVLSERLDTTVKPLPAIQPGKGAPEEPNAAIQVCHACILSDLYSAALALSCCSHCLQGFPRAVPQMKQSCCLIYSLTALEAIRSRIRDCSGCRRSMPLKMYTRGIPHSAIWIQRMYCSRYTGDPRPRHHGVQCQNERPFCPERMHTVSETLSEYCAPYAWTIGRLSVQTVRHEVKPKNSSQ